MVSKRKHIFYLIVGFNSFTHITIERYISRFFLTWRGERRHGAGLAQTVGRHDRYMDE
jgi:hypothetical protein